MKKFLFISFILLLFGSSKAINILSPYSYSIQNGLLIDKNGNSINITGTWESSDHIVYVDIYNKPVWQALGSTEYIITFFDDGYGQIIHEPVKAFPNDYMSNFFWCIKEDSIEMFSNSKKMILFDKNNISLSVSKYEKKSIVLLTSKNKNGIRRWFCFERVSARHL